MTLRGGPPVIRVAGSKDFALLPALEAASDTLLTGVPGVPAGALAKLPPPAGAPELSAALQVLVAGEPPVGFARLEQVDGQAHLEQLSVHPAAAGAGVGRALVTASLEWAKDRGYTSMTLCTFAEVPFNAPFYRSCGFAEVRRPGGELGELREHEKGIGLDALGERVAMRIELGPARSS